MNNYQLELIGFPQKGDVSLNDADNINRPDGLRKYLAEKILKKLRSIVWPTFRIAQDPPIKSIKSLRATRRANPHSTHSLRVHRFRKPESSGSLATPLALQNQQLLRLTRQAFCHLLGEGTSPVT